MSSSIPPHAYSVSIHPKDVRNDERYIKETPVEAKRAVRVDGGTHIAGGETMTDPARSRVFKLKLFLHALKNGPRRVRSFFDL